METFVSYLVFGLVVLCGVACPAFCLQTLRKASTGDAGLAALTMVLGFALSLRTGSVLPLIVGVYFVAVMLCSVLFGVGCLLEKCTPIQSTFGQDETGNEQHEAEIP